MRRMLMLLVASAALLVAAPAWAQARVPQGFVGIVGDGAFTNADFDSDSELGRMVVNGVESVRVPFHWSDAQPYETLDQVPADERPAFRLEDGVPTTYAAFDRVVRAAATRGATVLPILTLAPGWARKYHSKAASPPSGTAAYAHYAAAMVRRYGPQGSFWAENPAVPKRPIRTWQVWNEPNLPTGWADKTFAPGYVKLLRAARTAIRREDGGAKIVLAGLANFSWPDLAKIYRQPGARRLFDIAAVHPYTRLPTGTVEILRRIRAVMRKYHDSRKSLWITEWGFPSAQGKVKGHTWDTTRSGQGTRLRQALGLYAKNRRKLRIGRTFYYSWIGTDTPKDGSFSYAGLRTLLPSGQTVDKPALATYRRTALSLEGCSAKSASSTRCVRR